MTSALHQENVAEVEGLREDVGKHLGVLVAERMLRRIERLRELPDEWEAECNRLAGLLADALDENRQEAA